MTHESGNTSGSTGAFAGGPGELTETKAEEEKTVSPSIASLRLRYPKLEGIDTAFDLEISGYLSSPVPACSHAEAMRLLRKFAARLQKNAVSDDPIADYLPAVSEGTMKLKLNGRPHDEAVSYAKKLASSFSKKELAKDFLYGVAHNAPEYRTALASYYYIKNLPDHGFEGKYGRKEKELDWCAVCLYKQSHAFPTRKNEFIYANLMMAKFYLWASQWFTFDLNTAIAFLEEYGRLPRPACSEADYEHFKRIIAVIESVPLSTREGKLRKILKQSGLLSMTMEQIASFDDMLGYLDILHTDDSFGVTLRHTKEREQRSPLTPKGCVAYPVNQWTRKSGIDYDSISMLFDGIYD